MLVSHTVPDFWPCANSTKNEFSKNQQKMNSSEPGHEASASMAPKDAIVDNVKVLER